MLNPESVVQEYLIHVRKRVGVLLQIPEQWVLLNLEPIKGRPHIVTHFRFPENAAELVPWSTAPKTSPEDLQVKIQPLITQAAQEISSRLRDLGG